jgi:hypothetical protein
LPATLGGVLVMIVVAAASAIYLWSTYTVVNDHFDRISRARQIAEYGEMPFRDFLDPGYFLTLYASAAMLRLFDGALLGEVVLNLAAMSAGYAMAFSMAAQAMGSRWPALAALVLALVVTPRAYDYDKVLFYAWGLFALWRYIDRPSRRRLVHVSAAIALGGLFRYDTAVYLAGAATAGLAACYWGDWKTLSANLLRLAGLTAAFALPVLVFIQLNGGVTNAVDQILSYARREGARSELFALSRLTIEPGGRLADAVTPVNGAVVLSWIAWLLPLVTVAAVMVSRHAIDRAARARAIAAAALVASIALFVMRDPVVARVGAVMPVMVVLLAVASGLVWRRWSVRPVKTDMPAWVRVPVVALVVLLAVTAISAAAAMTTKPELAYFSRWRVAEFQRVPTPAGISDRLVPLADYVRACTRPADRVLATWFVPELYWQVDRGFAGGLAVLFGDHWSEDRFERHIVRRLETESVPIVIMRFGPRWIDIEYVREAWPLLADYVARRYEVGATTNFGVNDSTYQIWVRRDLTSQGRYGPAGLPCYGSQTPGSAHSN